MNEPWTSADFRILCAVRERLNEMVFCELPGMTLGPRQAEVLLKLLNLVLVRPPQPVLKGNVVAFPVRDCG